MTLETWLAVGSAFGAASIALVGIITVAWAMKRIDATHLLLQGSITVREAARSEVEKLHDALKSTNDALVEEQRAHRDEVAIMRRDLAALREQLAAAATPASIEAGLTRRTQPIGSKTPLPPLPMQTPAPAPVPVKK